MIDYGIVQVAGVADADEARMLADCGVNQIGFPLRLPVHEPDVSDDEAAAIIATLPPHVSAVLITYLDRAADIEALSRRLGVPVVQLHGDVSLSQLEALKAAAPNLQVIKSLIVSRSDAAALEAMAARMAPLVDAFITDTFDPATGASGATGRTHDWRVSRRLVEMAPRPIILAGGLTPENVRRAILEVQPAGVDVHTGVERGGRKIREKVDAFVREARAAFTQCRRR